jgi:PAS domain S-box-containing protein
VSLDGRWLRVNRSLCEITGYDQESLLSRTVRDLTNPDDVDNDKELARAIRAGELRSYHVEKRYRHAAGHEIFVLVSVSLVQDEQGRPLHAIFQITDISERKRLETFKGQFINNAAHELRSPLTTIAGVTALLVDSRESMPQDQIEQSLAALARQSERARELINNLLDLSQLERGLKVSLQKVRLASFVSKTLEAVPAPEEKVLTSLVPEGISVLADPLRLEQVLVNLLSNAYRYGGSSVTVEAKQVEKSAIISVQDDGAGIPELFAPRMFEEFTRGPNVGKNTGSGLGLAIVRQLAAALGGEVWYEPRVPCGSSFKVRLQAI